MGADERSADGAQLLFQPQHGRDSVGEASEGYGRKSSSDSAKADEDGPLGKRYMMTSQAESIGTIAKQAQASE